MKWYDFYDKAVNDFAISDGSMGVFLQKHGLKNDECPEMWNLTHPDIIKNVHKQYIDAGADLIITNTFGGNRIKLKNYNLESKIKDINSAAVKIAKKAANDKVIVAGDVGPTGKLVEPIGDISFDEMVDIYKEQIEILANSGVDVIFFETHIDILELKAGIIACKEVCDLPIIASVTFERDGRMLTGTTPESAFTTLEALGVDIIGTNCGTGPSDMLNSIKDVTQYFNVPIIAQANAGIPKLENGKTIYDISPMEFADITYNMVKSGVNIVGGCCGTTPEYIKLIKDKILSNKSKLKIKNLNFKNKIFKISGRFHAVKIDYNLPFVIIGERLNPTARKVLVQDILENKFEFFKEEAINQEIAGADILDLNMGISNQDEKVLMKKGVEILTTTVKTPISIDTSNPDVIKLALKLYPGKPLLNSITYETNRINLLRDIKKYGAAFIALPIDDNGIPDTVEKRVNIMKKIIEEAEKVGIDKSNILADPLAMTVSADQNSPKITLETLKRFKEELNLYTTIGLSNVSYGLPERGYINRSYISMLMLNGLTSAILNPLDKELMGIVKAADVLLGKDVQAKNYISKYSKININLTYNKTENRNEDSSSKIDNKLYNAIMYGYKENIIKLINEALENNYKPNEILNNILIPAINEVGNLYEKRIYFLPQLIQSAETMKLAFQVLEPLLKEIKSEKIGKIVIATVKGDVHDIGKNIVTLMLRNHGFEVIDLGKDVPNEKILETAIKEKADIVGLSALMTTTMINMKEFMNLKKDEKFSVLVGGAAVTKNFAESIGAYYAVDAIEAVKKAKELLMKK